MKQIEAPVTISRIGFCEQCFNEHRAHIGERFLVIGNTGYHIKMSGRNSPYWGFTPHFYRVEKFIGANVVYTMLCSMNDCGVNIKYFPERKEFEYIIYNDSWIRGIMTKLQWTSLLSLTRDSQYHL